MHSDSNRPHLPRCYLSPAYKPSWLPLPLPVSRPGESLYKVFVHFRVVNTIKVSEFKYLRFRLALLMASDVLIGQYIHNVGSLAVTP